MCNGNSQKGINVHTCSGRNEEITRIDVNNNIKRWYPEFRKLLYYPLYWYSTSERDQLYDGTFLLSLKKGTWKPLLLATVPKTTAKIKCGKAWLSTINVLKKKRRLHSIYSLCSFLIRRFLRRRITVLPAFRWRSKILSILRIPQTGNLESCSNEYQNVPNKQSSGFIHFLNQT